MDRQELKELFFKQYNSGESVEKSIDSVLDIVFPIKSDTTKVWEALNKLVTGPYNHVLPTLYPSIKGKTP